MKEPTESLNSAFLCMGTAQGDVESARDSWVEERWNDTIMWIDLAIKQLESAKAKVEAHINESGEKEWSMEQ